MPRTPTFLREQSKVYFKEIGWNPRNAEMAFLPDCFAVEMCDKEEKFGSLYLPDDVQQKYRPDAGWIVGFHKDLPLKDGQPVLVKYGTGKQVEDFDSGNYKAKEVRFYGWAGGAILGDAYGDPLVPPFKTDWCESIVAFIDGKEIVPAGTNVMLKVRTQEQGMIELLRHAQERECDAEIVCLGESAGKGEYAAIEVGKTALFYDGFLTGPGASWLGDGLVIVPQESVVAVY